VIVIEATELRFGYVSKNMRAVLPVLEGRIAGPSSESLSSSHRVGANFQPYAVTTSVAPPQHQSQQAPRALHAP